MVAPLPQRRPSSLPCPQAVAAGLVNQSTIDAAVSRVLAHKFSAGLFDTPLVNATAACEVVNAPAHRALARVRGAGGCGCPSLLLHHPP